MEEVSAVDINTIKFSSARKRRDNVDGCSTAVKKRRLPAGYIPFRRIRIPEQWKREIGVVEQCVTKSFESCTYNSLEKKERLRRAVFDVFTETRTMKEASIYFNVPFTTVQTYFHKSCKLVGQAIPLCNDETDDEEREKINTTLEPQKIGHYGHRLGNNISGLNLDELGSATDEYLAASLSSDLKGARKRKPKIVRHFLDNFESSEDLNGVKMEVDSSSEVQGQVQQAEPDSSEVIPMPDKTEHVAPDSTDFNGYQDENNVFNEEFDVSVVPDWCREELIGYIASVSEVSDDTKGRLRTAIRDIYHKRLTLMDACRAHNLGYNYLKSYYEAFELGLRKQARFIASLASDNVQPDSLEEEIDLAKKDAKRRKEKEKFGPPLDPQDTERVKAIEDGIVEVCKGSTYSDSQKKRLHLAVAMVVRGEAPVSVAATKAHLPHSTVQLYSQRTRYVLGTLLPPPAVSLRRSGAVRELKPSFGDNGVAKEEVPHKGVHIEKASETLTSMLAESSLTDEEKQKVMTAVLMIFSSSITLDEAAKRFDISPDTVQLYVNKVETVAAMPKVLQSAPVRGSLRSTRSEQLQRGSDTAFDEEVKEIVRKVLGNVGGPTDRRAKLFDIVYGAVTGKLRVKEACEEADLPASTARAYVAKARQALGVRSSTGKGVVSDAERMDTSINQSLEQMIGNVSGDGTSKSPGSSAMSEAAVQMLANIDFNKTSLVNVQCTREELMRKINVILRDFKYTGNHDHMRDALLEIFVDGKTTDEVCCTYGLTQQSVGPYMALVKVYCESEKQMEERGAKEIKTEEKTPIAVRPRQRLSVVKSAAAVVVKSAAAVRPSATNVSVPHKFEAAPAQSVVSTTKSHEESSESGSHEMEDGEKLNVMTLHSEAVRCSEEVCMKNIIAYLTQQQYRRSKDSQDKMRMCLENVLLDGLQVREALTMVKGPSEHVVHAYVVRCREAGKCITVDYAVFLEQVSDAMKHIDFFQVLSGGSETGSAAPTPLNADRRFKRRSLDSGVIPKMEGLAYLKTVLVDGILKPMTAYIEKLAATNFPIENSLITGLAMTALNEMPSQYHMAVTEDKWQEWASEYKAQHPEFDR